MRLIIFDFDGTLVDSRKLIWESHRIVFGDFGFPCPSREESLALIGMSLEKVLAQLAGPDAPVTEMTATYQRLLLRLREQPEFADAPFDGAAELLAMLAVRADTRLSIATGHVAQTIEPVLKTLGWREYFCNLQSADSGAVKTESGNAVAGAERDRHAGRERRHDRRHRLRHGDGVRRGRPLVSSGATTPASDGSPPAPRVSLATWTS